MNRHQDILITFVVPVYKVDYIQLRKCLESIIGQQGNTLPYEILIVDDGSPDDCPQICDEYVALHDNVRIIHQKNQGLSVVRNVGVDEAKGSWVAFVDGDDWIEPYFVALAEKTLKEAPEDSDILIWDSFSETSVKSKPIKFLNTEDKRLQTFSGQEKEVLIDKILPRHVKKEDIAKCTDIGITWGRIYRISFLRENNIYNVPGLRVMQDSVFNLWAFERARTICYQYEPIYHYSLYDESISKKYDSSVSETMRILYGHYSDYVRKCHDNEDYWQRVYIRTIRTLVKCLAKDYANPNNPTPMRDRVKKMEKDLSVSEFQTAIRCCDPNGQEIKFRFILFLLKNKLYFLSICTSKLFGIWRRFRNNVS